MSNPNAQVEYRQRYRLNLILSHSLKAALDRIVRRKQAQFPAFKITKSDVIRDLITAADRSSCPRCGTATRPDLKRPGAFWCDECQEPVIFDPISVAERG